MLLESKVGELTSLDRLGRPTKWIYNGDENDYEIENRTCCGVDFVRDRTGATHSYERDGLKRAYRIVSKASSTSPEVVTSVHFNGLTTTTTRSSGSTTLLVKEETLNLARQLVSLKTPDQNNDGVPETTTFATNYPAGGGTTKLVTYPDNSTRLESYYIDAQLKAVTGTAVLDVTYDYGVHELQGGGLWTKVTQANLTEWVTTYKDALERPSRVEYPDGAAELSAYYPVSTPAVIINQPAIPTSPGSIGKLSAATDPDGVTTAYTYDSEGRMAGITEAMPGSQHRVTIIARDVVDDSQIGVAYRTGKTVNDVVLSTDFIASEGRASRTESLGVTTHWNQTLPADGAWTSTSTTGDGQKIVKTYTEGNLAKTEFFDNQDNSVSWTSLTYDAFDRLATETDSRTGAVTFNSYTESGNLISSTDGGSRTTTWAYDVMGRTITIDQPDTTDAGGNPLANVTHTSYHLTGQIAAVWGDQTNPTYRTYDEQNRLVGLRTYRGLTHGIQPVAGTSGYDLTTWNYDSQRGWLASKRDAANLGADYTYTPAGRLETRKWARTVGGGAMLTTNYTYDAGKLATTSYNDGVTQSVGYTFDALGRQSQVTQGGNSWTYAYDPVTLQLANETITYDTDFNGTGDFTRVLARSQDEFLRSTGHQLLDGTSVETQAGYTYDDAGRLHTVGDGTDTFTYGYEPESHLVKTVTGPVHIVTNNWDTTRNALLEKENKVGTDVISAYGYTVNAIGQRNSVALTSDVGDAFTVGWGYNERGEITSADNSVSARSRFYQYDPIGNRIKSRTGTATNSGGVLTDYTANALNQYTAINAATPSHDVDGNQLTGPLPNDPTHVLGITWDGENRMTEAKNDGSIVGNYRYDPFGRRIYKDSSATGVRWFIYDGWNLVSEHQVLGGVATVLRTHLWGEDLSGSRQGVGGVGGLLSTNANELGLSGKFYPGYDGNGNVTDYLDSAGNIHAYFVYDPFGAVTGYSGVSPNFFFRFSTKYEDFETGLNYYGYRYYDPQQGRWINRDPIWEVGGLNLYVQSKNRTNSSYDILGLRDWGFGGSFSGVLGWGPTAGAGLYYNDDQASTGKSLTDRIGIYTTVGIGVGCDVGVVGILSVHDDGTMEGRSHGLGGAGGVGVEMSKSVPEDTGDNLFESALSMVVDFLTASPVGSSTSSGTTESTGVALTVGAGAGASVTDTKTSITTVGDVGRAISGAWNSMWK